MSRFRAACFTLNNYSDLEEQHLRGLFDSGHVRYIVFQREHAPTTGTPHLQGYVYGKDPRTMQAWHDLLGKRCAILRAKGTAEQNREYCTKEEGRDVDSVPFERGQMPQQGHRTDLDRVYAAIKEGAEEREVLALDPSSYFKYSGGIKRAIALLQGRREWKTNVFWWYGPTGSGKSREAAERFPEAYWKPPTTKWWDGYDGQADVIIDDYRRDLCTFAELLRLLDRYPMSVEYKGGTTQMLARNIVITTPRDPRDTWEGRTAEDIAQLLRRIDEVRKFGDDDTQPQPLAPLFNRPPDRRVIELSDSEDDHALDF